MGTGLPASQEAAAAARGVWDIRIDKTSIERILLDPESILEDPEAFWRSDPAYRLAESWHRNTGVSKSTNGYDKRWPAALKKLAALPREERKNRPEFRFLESLMGKTAAFEAEALPFIRSFLPANEIAFRTSVYLTTQTFPYAFMANGDMVVDILSLKFRLNADQIFNILTHETFHVGYGYNRYLREEPALDDGFIYSTLLDSLQNEGMATYMAYRAQSLFPAPFESDYRLLDNPQEVKRRFEWINRIFEGAESGHTGAKSSARKPGNWGSTREAITSREPTGPGHRREAGPGGPGPDRCRRASLLCRSLQRGLRERVRRPPIRPAGRLISLGAAAAGRENGGPGAG